MRVERFRAVSFLLWWWLLVAFVAPPACAFLRFADPCRRHPLVQSTFISGGSSPVMTKVSELAMAQRKTKRPKRRKDASTIPEYQHKITYRFGAAGRLAKEEEEGTVATTTDEEKEVPNGGKLTSNKEEEQEIVKAAKVYKEEVELVEALTNVTTSKPPIYQVTGKTELIDTLTKATQLGRHAEQTAAKRVADLDAKITATLDREVEAALEFNPTGLPTEVVLARKQPKPAEEEARLAAKYAAIEDVGDRAYAILVDLYMVEETPKDGNDEDLDAPIN